MKRRFQIGWTNQAILGADYDDSQDTFAQTFQYGTLAPDRQLIYEVNPLNNETAISDRLDEPGHSWRRLRRLTGYICPDFPVRDIGAGSAANLRGQPAQ